MFQNKNTHKRLAMTLGGIIGVMSIGTIITIATLDTTQEIPDGEVGTIGYALKKIIGVNWQSDVNVLQSRQLGGVNGEKYLRLTGALPLGCSQADQVLQGFDMDGTNPKCVTVPTTKRPRPILATLRDLDSSCYGGKIKISNPGYSSGGTTIPPRTINPSSSDPIDLYEDDKIETTDKCLLASLYMPDNSIIRLSANTTITLRYAGIPGGSGATSTDLDGGEMWARVLKPITDDSYFNVNTQEASVGVRGTSVWIKRDSGITTALPIDSGKLNPTDIANNSGAIVVYPKYGDLTALGTPVPLTHTITVNEDGASTLAPYRTSANELNFYSTSTTAQIYNDKPFVRMATLADIMDFKAFSGSNLGNLATIRTTRSKFTLHGGEHMKWKHASVTASDDQMQTNSTLTQEFSQTLPSDENEKSTLCLGGDSAGTAASSPLKQWWDAVPLGRENCIESNVSFLADYSKNDSNLYGLGLPNAIARIGSPSIDNGGIKIQSIGDYIQYTPPDLNLMKGAKVKITFQTDVQTLAAASPNRYIFDGGTGNWKFILKPDKTVTINRPPGDSGGSGNCYANVCEFQFGNVVAPNQLIFGALFNNISAKYVNPIGTTIQSISISPPASVGP